MRLRSTCTPTQIEWGFRSRQGERTNRRWELQIARAPSTSSARGSVNINWCSVTFAASPAPRGRRRGKGHGRGRGKGRFEGDACERWRLFWLRLERCTLRARRRCRFRMVATIRTWLDARGCGWNVAGGSSRSFGLGVQCVCWSTPSALPARGREARRPACSLRGSSAQPRHPWSRDIRIHPRSVAQHRRPAPWQMRTVRQTPLAPTCTSDLDAPSTPLSAAGWGPRIRAERTMAWTRTGSHHPATLALAR